MFGGLHRVKANDYNGLCFLFVKINRHHIHNSGLCNFSKLFLAFLFSTTIVDDMLFLSLSFTLSLLVSSVERRL